MPCSDTLGKCIVSRTSLEATLCEDTSLETAPVDYSKKKERINKQVILEDNTVLVVKMASLLQTQSTVLASDNVASLLLLDCI